MKDFAPEFNLKSVLNTDSFDRNMYEELRNSSKTLQRAEEEGSKDYAAFPHLLGDTWAGLFKNTPELNPVCPKGVEVNQAIMERVLQNPEFQAFREYTKLDELASALGAVQLGDELNKIIQENQEAKDAQEKAEEKQEESERAQNAAEALKEAAQMAEDPEKKKQLLNNAKKQMAKMRKAQKQANQLSQQAMEAINKQLESPNGQQALSGAIAQASANAVEDKKEVESLLASMGYGTGPGEKQKVPAKDRLALAEALKNTPKLRNVARCLGRMQKIANKKQKERTDDSIAQSDVDLGNELASILPSELALLKNPVTRKDFYKKFAQGELLQYAPRGKETLGNGPIICCVDTSGSMTGKDVESKAFMLSLLMIARKQKRSFACINYASCSEIQTWVFEKAKRINPGDIVEMAKFFWSGGTCFQTPLDKAVEIIENSGKFKKADIVFVTDGECSVNSDWVNSFNQKKVERRFSVISIKIGSDYGSTLDQFSDRIVNAEDFFDENVSDAAFTI